MNVFFDLNILVDVATRRPGYGPSQALYDRIRVRALHTGAFAACGYTTLFYVLRPVLNADRARRVLVEFRTHLRLVPFNERVAAAAHRLAMLDFEDACQAASAHEGRCDVIATRNVRDFQHSPVQAKTPEDILAML